MSFSVEVLGPWDSTSLRNTGTLFFNCWYATQGKWDGPDELAGARGGEGADVEGKGEATTKLAGVE